MASDAIHTVVRRGGASGMHALRGESPCWAACAAFQGISWLPDDFFYMDASPPKRVIAGIPLFLRRFFECFRILTIATKRLE